MLDDRGFLLKEILVEIRGDFMLKMLTAVFFFTSGAWAGETASCVVEMNAYSTTNAIDYTLIQTEILGRNIVVHREAAQFSISDKAFPVYYTADFNQETGTISGEMTLKVDEVGAVETGSVSIQETLSLMVSETYNTGKAEYFLTCKLD